MDKDQWLELLTGDVTAFNDYRKANAKEPVDLSGADLSARVLERANLSDVNLEGANLTGANLVRANLSGANLRAANFRRADLTESVLHRADMTQADFRGAKVGGLFGAGRICMHPTCFEQVLYDREQLEDVLAVLNRNQSWQIRYEIVAKPAEA